MQKLIVIGAGDMGSKVAMDILPEISEKFSEIFYFDNDKKKQGNMISGYQILSSLEYHSFLQKECALIIATDRWREIYDDCKANGVAENIIGIFDKYSFNRYPYLDYGYKFAEMTKIEGGYNAYIQKQISDLSLWVERQISKLWSNAEETVNNFSKMAFVNTYIRDNEPAAVEMVDHPLSLEEAMEELARKVPKAYEIWKGLFENGEKSYVEDPMHNLSVAESRWADVFDAFGMLHWKKKGWLLDIGCGIQEFPSYLKKYPVDYIVGMDPLMPEKPHPFQFVQGIAEFIPFKDESFEYVTAISSLDHVLLLDEALKEMHRVLKKGGKLLIMASESGSKCEYSPYSEDIAAVDMYHMFHINPSWFEPLMERCSFVKDSHYQDRWGNHFYAYIKC